MAFKLRKDSGGSGKRDYISLCKKTLNGIVRTLKKSSCDAFTKISSYISPKKGNKRLPESSVSQGRPLDKTYTTVEIAGKGNIYIKNVEETFDDFGESSLHVQKVSVEEGKHVNKSKPIQTPEEPMPVGRTVADQSRVIKLGGVTAVPTSTAADSINVRVTINDTEKIEDKKVIINSEGRVGTRNAPRISLVGEHRVSKLISCYDDEVSASFGFYADDVNVLDFEAMADDGYNPFTFKKKLFEPHPVPETDPFAQESGIAVDGMEIYAPISGEQYNPDNGMISFGFFAVADDSKIKTIPDHKSKPVEEFVPTVMFSFGATAPASGCAVSFSF